MEDKVQLPTSSSKQMQSVPVSTYSTTTEIRKLTSAVEPLKAQWTPCKTTASLVSSQRSLFGSFAASIRSATLVTTTTTCSSGSNRLGISSCLDQNRITSLTSTCTTATPLLPTENACITAKSEQDSSANSSGYPTGKVPNQHLIAAHLASKSAGVPASGLSFPPCKKVRIVGLRTSFKPEVLKTATNINNGTTAPSTGLSSTTTSGCKPSTSSRNDAVSGRSVSPSSLQPTTRSLIQSHESKGNVYSTPMQPHNPVRANKAARCVIDNVSPNATDSKADRNKVFQLKSEALPSAASNRSPVLVIDRSLIASTANGVSTVVLKSCVNENGSGGGLISNQTLMSPPASSAAGMHCSFPVVSNSSDRFRISDNLLQRNPARPLAETECQQLILQQIRSTASRYQQKQRSIKWSEMYGSKRSASSKVYWITNSITASSAHDLHIRRHSAPSGNDSTMTSSNNTCCGGRRLSRRSTCGNGVDQLPATTGPAAAVQQVIASASAECTSRSPVNIPVSNTVTCRSQPQSFQFRHLLQQPQPGIMATAFGIPSPFSLQTGLKQALDFAEFQPMSPSSSASESISPSSLRSPLTFSGSLPESAAYGAAGDHADTTPCLRNFSLHAAETVNISSSSLSCATLRGVDDEKRKPCASVLNNKEGIAPPDAFDEDDIEANITKFRSPFGNPINITPGQAPEILYDTPIVESGDVEIGNFCWDTLECDEEEQIDHWQTTIWNGDCAGEIPARDVAESRDVRTSNDRCKQSSAISARSADRRKKRTICNGKEQRLTTTDTSNELVSEQRCKGLDNAVVAQSTIAASNTNELLQQPTTDLMSFLMATPPSSSKKKKKLEIAGSKQQDSIERSIALLDVKSEDLHGIYSKETQSQQTEASCMSSKARRDSVAAKMKQKSHHASRISEDKTEGRRKMDTSMTSDIGKSKTASLIINHGQRHRSKGDTSSKRRRHKKRSSSEITNGPQTHQFDVTNPTNGKYDCSANNTAAMDLLGPATTEERMSIDDFENASAFVLDALLASWEHYLGLGTDELRAVELENAQYFGFNGDVMATFANSDLEVWRILEEMTPTCCMYGLDIDSYLVQC